jgi:adenylate cyclase
MSEGEMGDSSTAGEAGRRADFSSQQWRRLLTDGHAPLVKARHVFRYLPSAPRCKVCNNPFGGLAGHVLAAAGFRPSRKNPSLCTRCCDALPAGGAEVDVAVLFADVRGSTGLGERASAADFAALLNRFYIVATRTLVRHDAVIDKLIGDEVMAFFVRGISGLEYRRRAVQAGFDLLRAVGYGADEGPWLQLGAAVNAGVAYVGNVGEAVVDFTALGDTVNVAARMQQHAAAGELLVARGVADNLVAHAAPRTLVLRGHQQPVEAFVLSRYRYGLAVPAGVCENAEPQDNTAWANWSTNRP